MFEAYSIGVGIHLANHVSGGLAKLTQDFVKTEGEAAKLQKRIDSIANGMKAGVIMIGAGLAMGAAFKPAVDEAMKFERAMLRLKDIGGIDMKVVTQVRNDALSGKYAGIGAAESVDLVRDLHAAFGESKEALAFMPMFAGLARMTQGKYGKSAVEGEEDVRALAKVAERRGGTKSPQAMESAMDLAVRIQNASGGAVTPKDLLGFMSRMGAMGNAMSNDGILKMWALMQEQGGSKAGTALNSAMQNMINGRGTEGSGRMLRKLGWVDEDLNASHLKEQYGANWEKHQNKVTANSLKNAELAKSDMVGWVQSVGLPAIQTYLDKQHITDPKKRESETVSLLAQALSNRTGADSIALVATQLPRIMKDYHIADSSKGLAESVKSFDTSPMAKFQQLHAKFETALTNLGLAALPVVIPLVNKLAQAFQRFNEYAQKNPDTVRKVVTGILGLAGALVALGGATFIVNGLRAIGVVFRVVRGLGSLGPVASVLSRVGGFLAGNGGIFGLLARGIMMLGRAFLMNPIGLVITAIAGAAYLLYRNWSTIGPMLSKVWEVVRYVFRSSVEWIGEKLKLVWDFIKPAVDLYCSIWVSIFKFVKDGVMGVYDFISGVIGKFWDAIKNSAIGKAFAAVVDAISNTANKVYKDAQASNYAVDHPDQANKGVAPPASTKTVIVHTDVNMDGHKVAKVVSKHQAREMGRAQRGPSTVDNSMNVAPVGLAFAGS